MVIQRIITKSNTVVTKGKAGYRVLKLAGGQGDHEISLPVGSLIPFFFSWLFEVIGRNP